MPQTNEHLITPAHIDRANKMLAAFGKPEIFDWDEDRMEVLPGINIEPRTIDLTFETIAGPKTEEVDRWFVVVAVAYSNYPHGPDDVDIQDHDDFVHLEAAVGCALALDYQWGIDNYVESADWARIAADENPDGTPVLSKWRIRRVGDATS